MLKFSNHVGLDIGSSVIKLVQVEPVGDGGKYRLVAFGQARTPLSTNFVEANIAKAEVIKKLAKDIKTTSLHAVISLPESQVYTRVIQTPILPEGELTQAIRWQAEQYIPVPLADVVLKHQVLNEEDEKLNVLLVAAPNTLLNTYVNMLTNAGFETVAIETEILAVSRALVGEDVNSPTTMIVHVGAESTTLSVLSRGDLVLTQSISTGGTAVTRSLMAALGLEVAQAEEYKKIYGMDETKLEGKVVSAIKPVVDLLVAELKRVLDFYNVHGAKNPVKRLVLSGGTALMPGLVPYLTLNLNIEVQIGSPFLLVNLTDKQKQEIGDNATLYSTAVGLALKPT